MARTNQEGKRSRSRGDEPRGRTSRDFDDEDFEAEDAFEDDGDEPSREDGGSSGGVVSELKNVASDAALAVLAPVAKEVVTKAAKYAVKKGPALMEDTVKPALEDAGGPKALVGQLMSSDGGAGGLAGGLLSKLTPGGGDGGGGDAGDGTGKGRRMPVQQEAYVAAPIEVVYDQWTQFEDYPKFMHRVQRVEQRDDSHVAFHAKIWGINRMWEAEIVEQRPDERILFKSVNGVQLTGVVTFHVMDENLTLVNVDIDIQPDGPIEKFARGARYIKRAARGDLKRFKAYVEMHEEETGAWRGEIQDSEVVSESDEGRDDEYEEPEAEYEDEDEEEEPEEEDEEEREPARAGSSSRSSSIGSGGSSSRKRASSSKSRSGGGSSSRRRGSSNGGDPKSSPKGRSSSRSRGGSAKSSGSSSSSRSRSSRGKSSGGGSSKGRSAGSRSSRSKSSSRSRS